MLHLLPSCFPSPLKTFAQEAPSLVPLTFISNEIVLTERTRQPLVNGVGILFSPYVYERREAKLDAPLTANHNPFPTTIRTAPPPHHQASSHGFKLLFQPYASASSYLFKCNMTQNKLTIATTFQFSTFPDFHKFVSGHKWINCTSALSDWGLLFSYLYLNV